jgi:hypothetical protein
MNSPNLAKYVKKSGSGTVQVSTPDIIPDIPVLPGVFVKIDFVLSAAGNVSLESLKDPSKGTDTFTSSFGVSGSAELSAGASAGYTGLCEIAIVGSGTVSLTLNGNLVDSETSINATGTAEFKVEPDVFVKGSFVGQSCTLKLLDLAAYSGTNTFGDVVLFNKN